MEEKLPRVRQSIGLWVWSNVLQDRSFSEILTELKRLSDELSCELIGNEGLSIQLHLGPEARKRGRSYASEDKRAIFLDDLTGGIKNGKYPPVNVLNMPFWGEGREKGVILTEDSPQRREWHAELSEVVETAEELQRATSEPLSIIICPGKDEFRTNNVDFERAWEKFDEFLLPVVKATSLPFVLEWQTRQDGAMGVFPTPQMAIEWATRFNEQAGRKAMGILPHFAQSMSLGVSVADTIAMIIDAGLFFGWIHANGGSRASRSLVEDVHAVREGTLLASDVPFTTILDVAPGVAGKGNWALIEEEGDGLFAAANWLKHNPGETLYVGQCWKAWTDNPFEEVKRAVVMCDAMLRTALSNQACPFE